MNTTPRPAPLAIIGIGCIFPKAAGVKEYWSNIKDRVDSITEVPPSHWSLNEYYDQDPKSPDRTYGRRGGFLSPVDFDPAEFGITPNNIPATDPAQLLGLVTAQAAMRDAGYGPEREFERRKVSVILGVTGTLETAIPLGARLGHPIWRRALKEAGIEGPVAEAVVKRIADSYVDWQENSFPGLLGNVVAGRIANRLDLGGTNCVVDAACASSLSAAHMAGMELATGRADMVVTGGVDTFNDIFMYMCFSKTPALSPTGNSKPFDASGDGTILGEGLGMLVLKRLADAERDGDRIYAVLKGIGSSSDGRGKAIYAPSAEGQVKALTAAYELSGVTPDTIELVEAHGTGTKVGDAAEVRALAEVYRAARPNGTWAALGSVKSNIGHTKAAAGSAGLIKAVMALKHKVLPPTIKVSEPLPELASGGLPLYVNTEMRPWLPPAGHPRRAAVSAFGFGGSNFHAVLEEHVSAKVEVDWDGSVEILAFSGPDEASLKASLKPFTAGLGWNELRVKAMQSRASFSRSAAWRLVAVIEKSKSGKDRFEGILSSWPHAEGVYIRSGAAPGRLAILFPGQGSQYVGMGRDLACQFPEMLDALAGADAALGERLSDAVYPQPGFTPAAREGHEAALRATHMAQPAIGMVSLGALAVLKRFGVNPEMAAGHSYGELTALCAAGRISPDDLLRLSRLRGQLMSAGEGDKGTMLAALAPIASIEALIASEKLDVVLANKNAPEQAVLSGSKAAIKNAAAVLDARGIRNTALPVAAAFHSALVADAKTPLRAGLEPLLLPAARFPVYSNTTALPYPDAPAAAKDLLAGQLAAPVEFMDEVSAMHGAGARTFLEVGPGGRLTGLVKAILKGREHEALAIDASNGRGRGSHDLAKTLAQLAAIGLPVDLTPWEDGEAGVKYLLTAKKSRATVPLTGATPINSKRDTPMAAPKASEAALPRDSARSPASVPVAAAPVSPSMAQEGIAALQRLQEQTSALHRQYLESQETTQRTLLALIEQGSRMGGGAPTAFAPPPAQRTGAAPMPAPMAAPAPKAPAAALETVLIAVVAEKTGYPPETLNLDMGLESDLGIDSIKRVEILAALRDKLPDAPVVGPQHIGTLRTLRQIIDFMASGTAQAAPAPKAPAAALEAALIAVVAEKTGYPPETLNLDMGLESDLGIDSIKRVEILAALRDKLPNAPIVGAQHVGTLRTLRQIIAFMSTGAAPEAAAAAQAAPAAAAKPTESLQTFIERSVLFAVPLPVDEPRRPAPLAAGTTLWILDDGSPLAPAVTRRLEAAGHKPTLITLGKTPTLPPVLGGLILLAPAFELDAQGLWGAASERWLKDAFELLRAAAAALRMNPGSVFATVSRLDGAFGLGTLSAQADPLSGALAGLAKTARLEWPELRCKAIDADRAWPDADALAEALASELNLSGPAEIGLAADGLRVLEARPAAAAAGANPLSNGDVVVVTGGARGVTAEAALALAEAAALTLVILGRTEAPSAEPGWLEGLTGEAEIKKAVVKNLDSGMPTPKVIEEAFRRHMANRELRSNIARLEAAGATVLYRSADLRDPASVREALANLPGPVRALVHGAGALADRLIEEKTPEMFDSVFDTKVAGLRFLLEALDLKELKAVALFSSVTGRYGRIGQADYAMANEALNKIAQSLSRRLPACRVVSVNWGPWEGGMVTPALKKIFEAEGVGLLPLREGGQHLLAELSASGVEAVVTGSKLATAADRAVAKEPAKLTTAFERSLDLKSHPFLASHVINGRPVLPLAMMVEWLAHGAMHAHPGLDFCGVSDVRVLKGVILDKAPCLVRAAVGKAVKEGSLYRIPVELQGDGGTVHARGAVLLGRRTEAPSAAPQAALAPYPRGVSEAYAETLFHGPDLQGIESIEGCAEAGIAVSVKAAPAPSAWLKNPPRAAWLGDPLALDAALQAIILWSVERVGAPCLPSTLGRYRQFRDFPKSGLRIAVRITRHNEQSATADADFIDASGTLIARLEGSEHAIDASLAQAFRKALSTAA